MLKQNPVYVLISYSHLAVILSNNYSDELDLTKYTIHHLNSKKIFFLETA